MSHSLVRAVKLFVAIVVVLRATETPAVRAQDAKDEIQVTIEGKVGEWAIGAGGSRLAIRCAEGFDLIVVDCANGTILGKAPAVFPNEPCVLSADEDFLYVLCPKARQLRRFDLETLRERAITKFHGIDAEPVAVASGCSAKEGIAVAFLRKSGESEWEASVQMLVRETLQPVAGRDPRRTQAALSPPLSVIASANGASFLFYGSPTEHDCEVLTRDGDRWEDGWKMEEFVDAHAQHADRVLLSDDGRRVVAPWGTRDLFAPRDRTVSAWKSHPPWPPRSRARYSPLHAFDVPGWMSAFFDSAKANTMSYPFARGVSLSGTTIGFGFVPEGELNETQEATGFDLYNGLWASKVPAARLEVSKRFFYSNRAKRIVAIPYSEDRVVLRPFDAEAVIVRAPTDAPVAKLKPPTVDAFPSKKEVRVSVDGKIGEWAIGAGGSRLALRSDAGFDVAVVDVGKGTVLGQTPPVFPNEPCAMSADEDSLYVLCPKARELRRYDLETLRELAVTKFSEIDSNPVCVASGASAREPVAVGFAIQPKGKPWQSHVQFLDRETLRPHLGEELRLVKSQLMSTVGSASADGTAIAFHDPTDGHPCEMITRSADGWNSKPFSDYFRDYIIFTEDGDRLISPEGIRHIALRPDGSEVPLLRRAERPGNVPARIFPLSAFGVSGSLAAHFESENLRNSKPGERTPFMPGPVTIGYVREGGYVATHEASDFDFYCGVDAEKIGRMDKHWRKRVFYSDRAKRIVVIPFSNDRAILREFDAEDVSSTPGGNALATGAPGPTGSGSASVEASSADEVQIRIAGRIGEWAVGAGGSRLAVRDVSRSVVSVIDVAKGSVLCSSPPMFPTETCVLSADEDSLYVLCPRTKELKRFELDTLKESATTNFPGIEDQPVGVASGMSAKGEIAVAFNVKREKNAREQATVRMFDRETLHPSQDEEPLRLETELRVPVFSQGSANGEALVFYSETGGGCVSVVREGDRWTPERCRDTFYQTMYLSEDGKRVITEHGTRALRNKDDKDAPFKNHPIPYNTPRAVAFPLPTYGIQGALSAAFESEEEKRSTPGMPGSAAGPVRIGFAPEGEYFPKQIARGFDIYGPDGDAHSAGRVPIQRRIFYTHRAERIVVIPFSNDRVTLRKFVAKDAEAPVEDPLAMRDASGQTVYAGPKEEVEIPIEGKIGSWAVGAGGALLAVRSEGSYDIRVIDAAEGKVRCTLPPIFPNMACTMSADEDSLYVLCPGAGEMRRFDLATLTELAFTKFPGIEAEPVAVASGVSAKQNIAVAFVRKTEGAAPESTVQVLDRETLRPYLDEGPRRTEAELHATVVPHASANGEALLFCLPLGHMCELLTREGDRWTSKRYRGGFSDDAIVTDDSRRVITNRGSFDLRYLPNGLAPPFTAHPFPSAGHRACEFPLPAYGVPGTLSASFQSDDLRRSEPAGRHLSEFGPVQIGFVPYGEFLPINVAKDFDLYFGGRPRDNSMGRLAIAKRIYYSHRAKSIVVVPFSNDRVVLRKYIVGDASKPKPATDWPELPEVARAAAEKLAAQPQLEGGGPARIFRCSPDDETLALTANRKLLRFADDGFTVASSTPLSYDYDRIGIRGDYLVAVGGLRRKIDVLQASDGKLLRSVDLPSDECYDLAMHPTRPLSYISYRDETNATKSSILVFNELEATIVKSDAPMPGRSLDVAPNGSKLLVGAELISDVTVRTVTLGRFRPIVREFTPALRIALDYDLFDAGRPTADQIAVFEGKVDRTMCAPDSSAVAFLANRPHLSLKLLRTTNLESPPTGGMDGLWYHVRSENIGSDIAWHPTLDVVAALYGGAVVIHPSHDSPQAKAMAEEIAPGLTLDLVKESAERLWFSRNGRNLVVLGQRDGGSVLHVFPVKRPNVASSWLARGKSSRTPLEHLHALRGGTGELMAIRDVAAKFAPSTVVIRSGDSRGTGFVVSSRGYAMTCAHVLEPGKEVRVHFVDPDRPGVAAANVAATIVAQDHELDIALLRYDPPLNLPPVRFSTALLIAAGESVTVIGNPGVGADTLEQTVTTGVVSAPARTLGERKLIQVSAAINPGSSGGAAFDDHGRVIGMVTRKGAIEGAGFAIPAGELTDFLLRNAYVDDDSLGLQRTWVERASGRELTAEIVSIGDSALTVRDAKRDQSFEIPFERLSESDVRFLEAIVALRQARAQSP